MNGEILKAKDDEILKLFKMCNEKGKEIERLKEQLELYKVAKKDHEDLMKEMRKISNNVDLKLEIERLNNILNKLEKYINENYIYDEVGMKIFDASTLQDKLQELKGEKE